MRAPPAGITLWKTALSRDLEYNANLLCIPGNRQHSGDALDRIGRVGAGRCLQELLARESLGEVGGGGLPGGGSPQVMATTLAQPVGKMYICSSQMQLALRWE